MREHNIQAAYEEIFASVIPECIKHFEEKTKDYSGGPAFMLLGARGQFGDINRKFWKLYQALWEGKVLEGEPPEEILRDFFGHCMLTLYCLRHDIKDGDFDPEEMAARIMTPVVPVEPILPRPALEAVWEDKKKDPDPWVMIKEDGNFSSVRLSQVGDRQRVAKLPRGKQIPEMY